MKSRKWAKLLVVLFSVMMLTTVVSFSAYADEIGATEQPEQESVENEGDAEGYNGEDGLEFGNTDVTQGLDEEINTETIPMPGTSGAEISTEPNDEPGTSGAEISTEPNDEQEMSGSEVNTESTLVQGTSGVETNPESNPVQETVVEGDTASAKSTAAAVFVVMAPETNVQETQEGVGNVAEEGLYVAKAPKATTPLLRGSDDPNADDDGDKIYVSFDFGSGHEGFVQKYWDGVEGLEINGAIVTVATRDSESQKTVWSSLLDKAKSEVFDYNDNGQRMMEHNGLYVGLSPRSEYKDKDDFVDKNYELLLDPPLYMYQKAYFYVLWADSIKDTMVTITPMPKCGDELSCVYGSGIRVVTEPLPRISFDGPCQLYEDREVIYSRWDLGMSVGDSITLTGGNTYNLKVFFEPEWGYFISKDIAHKMKAENGCTIDLDHSFGKDGSLFQEILISVPVFHVIPDDAVINEPTCEEEGFRDYICLGCKKEVSEVLDALGHDWGEWVVTKEATESEKGEKTRFCKNDSSHKETEVIPKVTPETIIYTISFDLNGGTLDGETDIMTIQGEKGSTITILAAPIRKGYKFIYWKGSEYHPGDSYTIEGDHTFKAQWEKVEDSTEDDAADDEDGDASDGKTADDSKNDDSSKKETSVSKSDTEKSPSAKVTNFTTSPATSASTPKTGDDINLMLWGSLLAISFMGIVLSLFMRRKHD